MPKLVTYDTLVRVGKAILTKAQETNATSIASLTGVFRGYISSQNEISNSILKGDFYISTTIFAMSFGNEAYGVNKDTIIVAIKNNPNKAHREDWVIIESKLVNEMLTLKENLEDHISNKNNPHEVTLIQANGESVNDSTFQDLLSQL